MRDEYEEPQYGFTEDGERIRFDADYGRVGVIQVTYTACGGCGKAAPCLHVDQSEGEYRPGAVCRGCIVRLFEAECSGRELAKVLSKNPNPSVGADRSEPGKRDSAPAERVSGPACTKDRESDASPGDVGIDFPALVNRFLAWPLPESVFCDFVATTPGAPHRIGTNLMTADEARAMLEYVLAKNPEPALARQGEAPATPAVGLPGAAGEGPGKVTITCNEAGDCVAVTRTDDEGRILSVLWER
jgi:hypothetical protein